jgi:hypothetical protein
VEQSSPQRTPASIEPPMTPNGIQPQTTADELRVAISSHKAELKVLKQHILPEVFLLVFFIGLVDYVTNLPYNNFLYPPSPGPNFSALQSSVLA